MLACFWCDPKISARQNQEPKIQDLIDTLGDFLLRTPLERFAVFCSQHIPKAESNNLEDCARAMFDSYDAFLGLLNDENKREHLDRLAPDGQEESPIFEEARELRHRFRLAVQETFTGGNSPLRDHSISKGIF